MTDNNRCTSGFQSQDLVVSVRVARVLRVAIVLFALWVYFRILRDMALTAPDAVGGFVLGLLLGPFLWFALKHLGIELFRLASGFKR